ncbi:hypothetical protein QQ991_16175 [Weizmannia coagulans]|uniref:Uncharacterized protein n=2 Tax=Heyndrickxia TaxID=2837504 RepID=A0A0C5C4D6_HEYCO|nr:MULTISPECIES: hypothetical protein [Heyndrickxia]AJO21474.1 hypothetical protein SB48_HM08orf01041 [Heyndrickxia coagulans]AKN52901.1 hypothetical protein AB434_0496 [Heyndrickxia coagulans]APB37301.1 hypothetical protein BIZ35_11140 [Heyndrickxia coagulans]ATW82047.1 hypothetical protein CIW84_03020 [Heyndrickxia coagulans]KGB29480.1 hypothetical protein IE89_10685 [Heyndrickxia coagulans]
MFQFEDADLIQDREDLIAIMRMRFGDIPPAFIETIYQLNDPNTLQRLILASANAPDFEIVAEELRAESGSIRLTGERFNPFGKGNDGHV